MTVWFVSRHDGAVEWVARRGIAARSVAHLRLEQVAVGDVVIGILPVHLAAEICARGACYWHLCLDVPADLRGHPLSADQMEALGARLESYHIERRSEPMPPGDHGAAKPENHV